MQFAGAWHHGMSFSQGSYWRRGCITPQGVTQTSDRHFFCLQSLLHSICMTLSVCTVPISPIVSVFFFLFHNQPSLYAHYTSCLGPREVHKGPCLHLLSKPASAITAEGRWVKRHYPSGHEKRIKQHESELREKWSGKRMSSLPQCGTSNQQSYSKFM